MFTSTAAQRGITLIEQIVFVVIVSVGVIGLVSVMNPAIRASADPMVTKQFVAIAESLLNEILHQPFTWCDPDDGNASTAQSYAGCASNAQNAMGPTPAGETRDGSSGSFSITSAITPASPWMTWPIRPAAALSPAIVPRWRWLRPGRPSGWRRMPRC